MSLGFGFALPAYPLRGGGGNNPFNQSGPTLDLSFVDGATNVGNLSDPNGYTLNTNFITPQYQIAAQYVVWETGVGLVDKTFSQIITFSRASGATWFNSAGVLQGIDFSVTSNTIGTGSKTFTLDATAGVNRYWAAGDTVLISQQSNSANNMTGTVTSYNATTQELVVNVTSTGGSGTIASWRIGSTMPRFDYNPATLAAQGLLIEEARTNSIRNNTMVGAVAGTPGTLPTNWGTLVNTTTGLTTSVIGTGTENGVTYVDIRLNGTATGAGSWDIYFEPANGVAALTGQTWTGSLYWKLQAGSTTGLSAPTYYLYEFTSGIAFIVAQAVNLTFPTGAALNTQRQGGAMTLTGGATTAFARPLIKINIANGAAIDITLRIGLPQLELGAFATSVIPTTNALALGVTRSADVASVNTLSPWYNASAGTIYAETQLLNTVAQNRAGFDFNDGSISNRNIFRAFTTGGSDQNVIRSGGSTVSTLASATNPTAAIRKSASAYAINDFAFTANGSVPATSNLGAVPVGLTVLQLGSASGATEYLNGYLRRVVYYPRRLSNAELQSITS